MKPLDPDRTYRVSLLRADEAAQLECDSKNEYFKCCPHLSVFHNRGQTDEGANWTSCQFLGCGCTTEQPPSLATVAMRNSDELFEKQDRRNLAIGWLMIGMGVGGSVLSMVRWFL